MGDSAGGNLAAVVALQTRPGSGGRELDVPPPVAQGLIYPAARCPARLGSMRTLAEGFFLTRETMEFYRRLLSARPPTWETPGPRRCWPTTMRGLAPALVVTAGFDPLRDDGGQLRRGPAGPASTVDYRCYDDQVHGFMGMGIMPDSLALATEVFDAMGRLMRRSRPAAGRDCRRVGRRPDARAAPPLQLADGPTPGDCWHWSAAASGSDGLLVRRRAAGGFGVRRGAGAAHRGRLRASRAPGGRAGEWFAPLGGRVEGLMVLARADAEDQGAAAVMRAARFVYLGGSSPMHLRSVLKNSMVWEALLEAWPTAPWWSARRGRPWPSPIRWWTPGAGAHHRPRTGRRPGGGAPLRGHPRGRPRREAPPFGAPGPGGHAGGRHPRADRAHPRARRDWRSAGVGRGAVFLDGARAEPGWGPRPRCPAAWADRQSASVMVTDSMTTCSWACPTGSRPTRWPRPRRGPHHLAEQRVAGGRAQPSGPLTMKNWLPLVLGPALAMASEPIS